MDFWKIGIIILCSHFVEGVSGFGCMVLALPFVSAIVGIRTAVPLLVLLSSWFDLTLVWQDRKKICVGEVVKMVVITGITMPLGFLALKYLTEKVLGLLLGAFMMIIAIYGFITTIQYTKNKSAEEEKRKGRVLFLPLAGLAQGAFGGSGPFMILYAQGVLKDKDEFRGTMAAVWTILNVINLVQYYYGGMLELATLLTAFRMIPFLIGGFFMGTWMHKRISEYHFSQFIYGILFFAGAAMIY